MNSQDSSDNSDRRSLLIPRSRRREFIARMICLTILGFVLGDIVNLIIERFVISFMLSISQSEQRSLLTNFNPITKFLYERLLFRIYPEREGAIGVLLLIKEILQGASFGTILGTLQWCEFRKYVDFRWNWIIANSIGYAISANLLILALITSLFPNIFLQANRPLVYNFSSLSLPDNINYTGDLTSLVLLVVMGVILIGSLSVGFAQWVVLRTHIHRVLWWIPVSLLTSTAYYISFLLTYTSGAFSRFLLTRSVDLRILSDAFLPYLYSITFILIGSIIYGGIQSLSLCFCDRKTNLPS